MRTRSGCPPKQVISKEYGRVEAKIGALAVYEVAGDIVQLWGRPGKQRVQHANGTLYRPGYDDRI